MKVLTILGTRPEIIRLSLLIPKLDRWTEHILLHTGQNYEPELDSIFFETLKIRMPNLHLDSRSDSVFMQIGKILKFVETCIEKHRPDACVILGDTNSGLSAMVCEKMGVPVFHMEAGNRCFDLKVPEEQNRKIIDHVSSWLFPYTEGARSHLLREGLKDEHIFVTGNPIFEVLEHYREQIDESEILKQLDVHRGEFFLATAHRAENVDVPDRLLGITRGLNGLAGQYGLPIIWSVHPRTRMRLQNLSMELNPLIKLCAPFNLFDFVKLEKSAFCVLTDSGTVQEECCLFHVPAVTLRDTTERPETILCGSNILVGCNESTILDGVNIVTQTNYSWDIPSEYTDLHVTDKVLRLLVGNIGK